VAAPSLAALGEQLRVPERHYVLLVAADTRGSDGPGLVDAAEALVRAGVSYACCWGPDCERLERVMNSTVDGRVTYGHAAAVLG
jgi:hypothetical protein